MINYTPIFEVMQWFDQTLVLCLQNEAREGRPVHLTCSKGCSACCSEQVITSTAEAGLILASLTDSEREELKLKVIDWLQKTRAAGLNPTCTDDHQFDATDYRRLNIPCPLLKNGLCSVYERRPFSCRMFMTTGPRTSCEDLKKRPRQKFLTIRELDAATWTNFINAANKAGFISLGMSHLGFLLAIELGLIKES